MLSGEVWERSLDLILTSIRSLIECKPELSPRTNTAHNASQNLIQTNTRKGFKIHGYATVSILCPNSLPMAKLPTCF